jgi:glycosyltransferase involved in cell wall biosynthesis
MERVVESLCQATRGRVDCRVLAFNDGPHTLHEEVDGIPVTRAGVVATGGSVPFSVAFPRALRTARADLMVVHEPNPWALVSLALVRPRIPLAVWFHSEVVRNRLQYALFYHPLVRAVYAHARRVVVSSAALADNAAALQPYRDRVTVIPFGIDTARWTASPKIRGRADAIRARTGSRPLLLFAGRMVPYKGLDVLLRALQTLDVAAVLAGSGPSREASMVLARELSIDDRVSFPGEVPRDELAALYHASDLFVLPSVTKAEAFGYVQLEAMACGKPVVSTRVASGVPWVNQHGVTGLTVPPGDVDALRNAIATLAADPALRARMGAAGRARVQTEFGLEQMAERTMALYAALTDGR